VSLIKMGLIWKPGSQEREEREEREGYLIRNLGTQRGGLAVAESVPKRGRVSAAVEDGMDLDELARNGVVDRERELVGNAAMVSEYSPMNSSGCAE